MNEHANINPELDEINELLRKQRGDTTKYSGPDAPWRQGYPYDRKISRKQYEEEKYQLQIEPLKLQAWVKRNDEKSSSSSKAATPQAKAAPSNASLNTSTHEAPES